MENQLSAADADALNDLAAREYTPWRVLDHKGDKVLIQWRGYSREDASCDLAVVCCDVACHPMI